MSAVEKVLSGVIDVAGEPKPKPKAVDPSAPKAPVSALEQKALTAWKNLTKGKDLKEDGKAGASAAAGSAAAPAKAAEEEKPWVFDARVSSDSAKRTAAEFEAAAFKQFEALNAYQTFAAVYAQLLQKHGGR